MVSPGDTAAICMAGISIVHSRPVRSIRQPISLCTLRAGCEPGARLGGPRVPRVRDRHRAGRAPGNAALRCLTPTTYGRPRYRLGTTKRAGEQCAQAVKGSSGGLAISPTQLKVAPIKSDNTNGVFASGRRKGKRALRPGLLSARKQAN
jgi:hypothetical protein